MAISRTSFSASLSKTAAFSSSFWLTAGQPQLARRLFGQRFDEVQIVSEKPVGPLKEGAIVARC